MGLREAFANGKLAEVPESAEDVDGLTGFQMDPAWTAVGNYIAHHVLTEADKVRRKLANDRLRLYKGGGDDLADLAVGAAFSDVENREERKKLVPFTKSHSIVRNVTDNKARVYAKPAKLRTVEGEENNKKYQEVQLRTDHDAAMRWADIRMALNNDTFWLFRTRDTPQGREPRTDILGPDMFTPIVDRFDKTKLLGIAIEQVPISVTPGAGDEDPHWLVWTPNESFKMTAGKAILTNTIMPNTLGIIPGLLVSSGYRATELLDPVTGQDVISAHLEVWLLEIIGLKEAKSLNQQAVFSGETGRIPTGQTQNSSRDMVVPDGVGYGTINRGVDIKQFADAADHKEERVATTHGIPPAVLRQAGATSGHEIDLRRIPLEEIREDRIGIFRKAERAFAEVQSIVLKADMPSLAFDTTGWRIDYAEIKRPQTEKEKYEVRKLKRSSGHSNPVSEAIEDNPDLTKEDAAKWVSANIAAWAEFIMLVRALNVANSADATNPGQNPAENGSDNAPKAENGDSDDDNDEKEPETAQTVQ